MYKFLIVEDEPRQLRALINIIQQLRSKYEINQAIDGKSALEFLNKHTVDVVITDIRMPEMDGMQLIEALYEKKYPAKIILLTGYGEFEYAQKAIKLGIYDYIVKPVGKSDIERLLAKVEQNLENEQTKLKKTKELEKKLDDSFPVFIAYLLNKWVNGTLSQTEKLELEKSFKFVGSGVAIIMEMDKYNLWSDEQIFELHLKTLLQSWGQSITFAMEGHNNKWITLLNFDQNTQVELNKLIDILNKLILNVKTENDINLIIGISSCSDILFTNVKPLFEEAAAAINKRFFFGTNNVIAYTESVYNHKTFNLHDQEEELSIAVRKPDIEAIAKVINNLFSDPTSLIHIEAEHIKEEVLRVVLNQSKVIIHFVTKPFYDQFISKTRSTITQCADYRALRHDTKEILFTIVNLLHIRDNNNSLIIQQCQKYIDTHYQEDMSLDFLAHKYHFNASYFSNLFKNHAGISLSEYLVKVRIEQAYDLLINSDYKISEIALKVGYKDAAYFIRMFKREKGLSPNKFRQLQG